MSARGNALPPVHTLQSKLSYMDECRVRAHVMVHAKHLKQRSLAHNLGSGVCALSSPNQMRSCGAVPTAAFICVSQPLFGQSSRRQARGSQHHHQ